MAKIVPGISSGNAGKQQQSVNVAVSSVSSLQDSVLTDDMKIEAIKSINNISSVVTEHMPKINTVLDSMSAMLTNLVDNLSNTSINTDVLQSTLTNFIENLSGITIKIDIEGKSSEEIKGISDVLSFLSSESTGKKLQKLGLNLNSLMSSLDTDTAESTKEISESINNITNSLSVLAGLDIKSLTSILKLMSSDKTGNRLEKLGVNINRLLQSIIDFGEKEKAIDKTISLFNSITSFVTSMDKLGMTMAKVAGGIALLGLSIFGMTMLFAENPMLLLGFAAGLTVVGVALWAFNKLVEPKNLLLGAAAIALLGLSIWGITEIMGENDFELIFKFSAAILTIGGTFWLFNKLVDPAKTLISAAAIAVAGLSMYVIGNAIQTFENVSLETVGIAALSILGIGVAMSAAGTMSANIIMGAAAIGLSALAVWGLTGAIGAISETNIDIDKLTNFGIATVGIIAALALIGNPITLPFVLIGAATTAAVAGATLLMSGALFAVSKVPILKPSDYDAFSYGANSLADIFANVGGPIKSLEILAGAATMTIVSGATVATALGITLFSNIISDPSTVSNAITAMDTFVTGTVQIFSSIKAEDFASVALGITAFAGLGNMVGEIAKSVAAIGNLTFEEKSIVNGKLVTTSSRTLTEADFKRVGDSIGLIISSLTNPLAAIGDQTEGIIFKSNKVEDGIAALSSIGNIFTPLVSMVTAFSDKNIDSAFIANYNKNISMMLQGTSQAFAEIKTDYDEDTLELFGSSVSMLDRLIKTASDEATNKATTALSAIPTSIMKIKNSMNDLDLGALTAVNEFLVNIQNLEDSKVMKELAEAFEKLAEALQPQVVQTTSPQSNNINTTTSVTNTQMSDITEAITSSNTDIVNAVKSVTEALQNTLKVKIQQPAQI